MESTAPTIPDTRFKVAMAVACIILAAMAGVPLYNGKWWFALVPALAIVGLVRRVMWGWGLAMVLLWLLLLLGVGFMLPQGEADAITGNKPVPLEEVLTKAAICIGLALVGLHLLGLYKKVFRPEWF